MFVCCFSYYSLNVVFPYKLHSLNCFHNSDILTFIQGLYNKAIQLTSPKQGVILEPSECATTFKCLYFCAFRYLWLTHSLIQRNNKQVIVTVLFTGTWRRL